MVVKLFVGNGLLNGCEWGFDNFQEVVKANMIQSGF